MVLGHSDGSSATRPGTTSAETEFNDGRFMLSATPIYGTTSAATVINDRCFMLSAVAALLVL